MDALQADRMSVEGMDILMLDKIVDNLMYNKSTGISSIK